MDVTLAPVLLLSLVLGNPIPVEPAGTPRDIKWANGVFNVLWGNPLRFGRITADGTMLGSVELFPNVAQARMAWNGSHFLVVYRNTERTFAVRLTATGEPAGEPVDLGTDMFAGPFAVASDGRDFLVLWTGNRRQEAMTLQGVVAMRSITAAGEAGEIEELPRMLDGTIVPRLAMDLIRAGDHYRVLWYEDVGKHPTTYVLASMAVGAKTPEIVSAGKALYGQVGATMVWTGSDVIYVYHASLLDPRFWKQGLSGEERILWPGGRMFLSGAAWDGSQLVAMLNESRFLGTLVRGTDHVDVESEWPPLLEAAPNGRVAVFDGSSIRFLGGRKTRAVR